MARNRFELEENRKKDALEAVINAAKAGAAYLEPAKATVQKNGGEKHRLGKDRYGRREKHADGTDEPCPSRSGKCEPGSGASGAAGGDEKKHDTDVFTAKNDQNTADHPSGDGESG